jgi:hypothetical protein
VQPFLSAGEELIADAESHCPVIDYPPCVVDAVRIDTHMLRLLDMCAERLINDRLSQKKATAQFTTTHWPVSSRRSFSWP